MGYYTDFKLSVSSFNSSILQRIVNEELIDYYMDYNGYCEIRLHGKWYDHKKDMKRISEMFPDVLFTLDGDGEESGDIWREYYKDGKVQEAGIKIAYEEFNESKLTEINKQ